LAIVAEAEGKKIITEEVKETLLKPMSKVSFCVEN